MPTPRSVSDIKSNLLRPALTSHFEVQITLPTNTSDPQKQNDFINFLNQNSVNYLINQDKLNLLCCEATLPGSNLATLELTNDYAGVTERHAYRRIYDDRIDLTFYVDAENYLPIHFFEVWMKFIADESIGRLSSKGGTGALDPNYFYRVRYPSEYMSSGMKVIKFERDYRGDLTYQFVNAFPISLSSMPISYESSSLLKCTVSMSYIRYVLLRGLAGDEVESTTRTSPDSPFANANPIQQAEFNGNPLFINPEFNIGGIPDFSANASGNTVDRRVEAGLAYVGRNFGPIAPFSGI